VVSGQQAKPEKEHQAITWQAGSGLDGESGRVVIGETGKKGVDVGESLAAELLPSSPLQSPPCPNVPKRRWPAKACATSSSGFQSAPLVSWVAGGGGYSNMRQRPRKAMIVGS
jgi:hypothetical protein